MKLLDLFCGAAGRNMSSKYHLQILVAFFVVISMAIVVKYVKPVPKSDDRISERVTQLELEKIDLKRQHLERNADLYFYGAVGLLSSLSVSIFIVASGLHRAKVKQASVHLYKIGESEIRIHERDLSLAAPIAMGLMNAEQLKQMNGGMEKAFELSCRMAEVQNRHLKALIRGNVRALPAVDVIEEAPPVPAPIPTFHDLIRSGELARGKPMILGYINHVPRRGSFLDIYSAAVAGESGSGKTSTMLFLLGSGLIAQSLIVEGLDPHYPHPRSLAFKTKVLWEQGVIRMATYYDQMIETLKRIEQTIENRLAQRDKSTIPVVLLIDEVAFLMTTSLQDQLAHTMRRVSMEGRKCDVFMLASSQTWLASTTGGNSVLRDTLTSAYIHKIKPKQAQILLQDKAETEKVKRYCRKAGDVLLCSVQQESEIARVPYTTENDMQDVIDLVNETVNRPVNSQHVDRSVDRSSQPTERVEVMTVDLVDQVKDRLKNPGDLTALAQSTGFDKAYLSRVLNRKQPMSKRVEECFNAWLTNYFIDKNR